MSAPPEAAPTNSSEWMCCYSCYQQFSAPEGQLRCPRCEGKMKEGAPDTGTPTLDLTGCVGFTEAEREGVARLANRIRLELHLCDGETRTFLRRNGINAAYLRDKRTALRILNEALAATPARGRPNRPAA